jgi:NifU-like protein involved in Fe-S cluster formation
MPRDLLSCCYAPLNAGPLDDADAVGEASIEGRPPLTHIYLCVVEDRVVRASFTTFGCFVAVACGSVLAELLVGKSTEECAIIYAQDLMDQFGGLPPSKQYCADLAIRAMNDALKKLNTKGNSQSK